MTGDEQFEQWRLQFSCGYDDSPYEYAKASWEASAIASRHETVEEIIKLCQQRTLAIDPVYEIIAAIRVRYPGGTK